MLVEEAACSGVGGVEVSEVTTNVTSSVLALDYLITASQPRDLCAEGSTPKTVWNCGPVWLEASRSATGALGTTTMHHASRVASLRRHDPVAISLLAVLLLGKCLLLLGDPAGANVANQNVAQGDEGESEGTDTVCFLR